MGNLRKNQDGFEHVALIVVLVVVIAIASVGYKISNKPVSKAVTVNKTATATVPTSIKSKSDVTSVKNSLDTSTIDSELNPSQLDKDMSDLR